jgi:hypothetical protein
LSRRGRSGVSAYVEAFILIAIAAGGSAVVLGAVLPFGSGIRGPSVAIQDESIHQGAYLAIERLTVMNPGQTPISSFVVSTSQVPDSASYCYVVYDLATGAESAGTCPAIATNPSSVAVVYPLRPGGAAGVVITIIGSVFGIGSSCMVTVTTSAGAQQTVGVLVAPA